MSSPTFFYRLAAILLLLGSTLLSAPRVQAGPYSALVVDAGSGKVLFEQNADAQRYPASLTKMMTLYMTFDALKQGRLSLRQSLWVSPEAASKPPSKLGLRAGDSITVNDAILGLVTRSANDAATVLGESLGGTEESFARQMTAKAHALGMSQTYFRNASGLPDPFQVTTAWDMFRLALALQRHFPEYYRYFSTDNFYFRNRVYSNHNHLLSSYAGADGIKTGYIRTSGYNLVASAQRNGTRLIGVVFGGETSRSRDSHMREILDMGFAQMGGGGAAWQTAYRYSSPSPATASLYTPNSTVGRTGSYSISRVASPSPATYTYGDRFDSAYPTGRSAEATATAQAAPVDLAVTRSARPKVTYASLPTVTVAQISSSDSRTPSSGSIQPFQRYSSGAVVKENTRLDESYPTAETTAAAQESADTRREPASWSGSPAPARRTAPVYNPTGPAPASRIAPVYTYTGASSTAGASTAPRYTYTGPSPASATRTASGYTGNSGRFDDNPAYGAVAADQDASRDRTETAPPPPAAPTSRVATTPTWRSGSAVAEEGTDRPAPTTRVNNSTLLPPPTLIAQSKSASAMLQGDDDEEPPFAPSKPIPASPSRATSTATGTRETSGSIDLIGRPMYEEVTTESSEAQPDLLPKAVPAQKKPVAVEQVTKEKPEEQPTPLSSRDDEQPAPAAKPTAAKKPAAEKAPSAGKTTPPGKMEPAVAASKASPQNSKSPTADKAAKANKPEQPNPTAKNLPADKKSTTVDKKPASQDKTKAETPALAAKSKTADKVAQSKVDTTQAKAKPEAVKVAAVAPASAATTKPGLCQVQVGAFSSKADAAKQLAQASQAAPAVLSPGRAVVTTVERGGKTLYRACFKGLNQAEAGNACQTLKRKQMGCFLQQGS